MFVVHADVDLLTWDEYLGLPYETRNTDLIDGKMIDPDTEVMLIARRSSPTGGYVDLAIESADTITSPLLPGFEFAVNDLFIA